MEPELYSCRDEQLPMVDLSALTSLDEMTNIPLDRFDRKSFLADVRARTSLPDKCCACFATRLSDDTPMRQLTFKVTEDNGLSYDVISPAFYTCDDSCTVSFIRRYFRY
jgi:hypothetical protein